jgi:hypothetical protein
MVGSSTSYFTDPADLVAAWQGACRISLVASTVAGFSASVTRISLPNLLLVRAEEIVPRIIFVRPLPGAVLTVFPLARSDPQLWAGLPVTLGETVTISGVSGAHGRTLGPSRWGVICCSGAYLSRMGRTLNGSDLTLPAGVMRRQPSPREIKPLITLFSAAMRITGANLRLPTEPDAARGLEQELVHLMAECLSSQATDNNRLVRSGEVEVMAQLEDAVRTVCDADLSNEALAARLGVPVRRLSLYCHRHLGISPRHYLQMSRPMGIRSDL